MLVNTSALLAILDAVLLVANRRKLSLVDRASFDCMRRPGIKLAYAFDDDFQQQGFAPAKA